MDRRTHSLLACYAETHSLSAALALYRELEGGAVLPSGRYGAEYELYRFFGP
jgi:hypothetical protein